MSTSTVRLLFTLPVNLRLSVPLGRHHPCLAACVLHVKRGGDIEIAGPHRDAVFDQARRFLRIHAKGHGPLAIAAILLTPPTPFGRGGQDTWHITAGAEIVFSPTSIRPTVFLDDERAHA